MDRIPVIFDTDLGEDIDDLYALYMALLHPVLDVIAVTTVHGDTLSKARLAKKVLRLAGRSDIPVGVGIGMSEERFRRGQTWPDPVAASSFMGYLTHADDEWDQLFPDAQDVIAEQVSKSKLPVALIIEGAFSNIGRFIVNCKTEAQRNIKAIAVMGGENDSVMSEWNVLCDPEAADIVFSSSLPVFMGTYNITARMVMPMDKVKYEFGARNKTIYNVLYDCTVLWGEKHLAWRPGPVLYDLAPLFWLINPELIPTKRSWIRVELDGIYTRGQTVRVSGDEEGNVYESIDLNAEALVSEFIDIIHKGVNTSG
ncbi:MAG: nucleoside hydrolase [Armatimonadota bacterium]